jgi:serine/threonine-protein kinase
VSDEILERLRATLSDRYDIERELGQGGMATVYLAKDVRHEREVAIKVLHPELSASIGAGRFEREIKLAARLQHPHILGLYDSGETEKLLYYVMPFVKGESLRDRLEREGQLPIDDAIQIALEVADALGHAHAQGVVHRDIKPENILLSGGHALVADFGIARAATEAGGSKLTQTGMAVGTPVYMAPEQAVGDQVGPTTDLYSLGCVLYEMLAGEPPFLAKSAQALMARHAMEAVPSVRIVRNTVPEEVEDAIFASMAKVPADRPQNAAQFAELLGMPLGATASRRSAIRHTASRRVPTGVTRGYEPEILPWWRSRAALAVIGLLVLGGGFAAWQLLAGGRRTVLSPADAALARKVAVLYFDNPSANPELDPVTDGLTEQLIATLRTARIDVVSRTGVLPYRGTDIEVDSVARALQVGTIVRGSVALEGNSVRISTWLTNAEGTDLGQRDNVTVPRDSLVLASDRVAREVAEKLRSRIGEGVQLAETQARAGNQEAFILLQRAEKTRNDAEQTAVSSPAEAVPLLTRADSLLELAARADPAWADPLVVRGEVALQRSRLAAEDRAGILDSGLALSNRALALDPGNARSLALRGSLQYAIWAITRTDETSLRKTLLDSAEANLLSATRADPTLGGAYATLSNIMYERKDVQTALKMALDAYTADRYLSNSAAVLNRLFFSNYDLEQFGEADRWCDEGHERFPGNLTFTMCQLWLMTAPDEQPDAPKAWRAVAQVDSLLANRPAGVREFQSRLARILAAAAFGKRTAGTPSPLADSARRVLLRTRPEDRAVDPGGELPGYEAVARVRIGDHEEAIALLRGYVAANPDHSFNVGQNIHWWWRDIRTLPAFASLLARRQ